MKSGRPVKKGVEDMIKKILTEQSHITPTEIKRRFIKKENKNIHWDTIKGALTRMVKKGIVQEIISNQTDKRVTAIYALTEWRKRR